MLINFWTRRQWQAFAKGVDWAVAGGHLIVFALCILAAGAGVFDTVEMIPTWRFARLFPLGLMSDYLLAAG